MSPAIMKMLTAMVGPEQIAEMVDGLSAQLITYKNSFALLDGEEELTIILFEDEGQMAATIAALDENNKIIRQVETVFIKDLFLKILKPQKDA
ncbi:MAG: hypothetical protein GXO88_07840 [Chlorobi bacterium]|nr:hypothetical protein [Chlorobiota bacterium]